MARPNWFKFLGLEDHPVLDRLQSLLSGDYSTAEDRAVFRVLQQLLGTTPAATVKVDAPAAEPDAPAPPRPHVDLPIIWLVVPESFTLIAPRTGEADAPVPAATDSPTPQPLPVEPEAREAITLFGGTFESPVSGTGETFFGSLATESRFVVLYNDMLDPGLVIDRTTMTVLPGGVGDFPELGRGDNDILIVSGDFSSGSRLPTAPDGLDTVVVAEGFDYNLSSADGDVDAGETLTINAAPLGDANRMIFDGSAETDGRFVFYGSDSVDSFYGGAGNDRIIGSGGGDMLAGGAGRDEFVYTSASDSTGADYDTIGDFNAAQDRIDVVGRVSGFAASVTAGTLSHDSFGADLAAAAGGLGASQAMWFAPDAGDLAGNIFLVVDSNGIAGYQDGEDLVIAIAGAPLADLSGHTDFFI